MIIPDLPVEIWFSIFSNLTFKEFPMLRMINHLFYNIIDDPNFIELLDKPEFIFRSLDSDKHLVSESNELYKPLLSGFIRLYMQHKKSKMIKNCIDFCPLEMKRLNSSEIIKKNCSDSQYQIDTMMKLTEYIYNLSKTINMTWLFIELMGYVLIGFVGLNNIRSMELGFDAVWLTIYGFINMHAKKHSVGNIDVAKLIQDFKSTFYSECPTLIIYSCI